MSPRTGCAVCAALAVTLFVLAVANAVKALSTGNAIQALAALCLAAQAALVWQARALYTGPAGAEG